VVLIDENTPLSTLSSGIRDRLDQFKERIKPHWEILCKHDPVLDPSADLESIDFEEDEVILNSEYREAYYNQWYDHEIRIDFQDLDLTLEEFEDKVIEDERKRKEALEAEEEYKRRRAAQISDDQERQTFERLKKKFEAESSDHD